MQEIPIKAFLSSLVAMRDQSGRTEVLLLQRTQTLAGEWCQIAGRIEPDETAWQTALRELREETGLTPLAFYSADICEQFYEVARDAITLVPVFVAMIDPEDTVVLNHEHSDFQWVSIEQAIQMVTFGGQRRVLRWIDEEFVQRPPSAHLKIEIPAEH